MNNVDGIQALHDLQFLSRSSGWLSYAVETIERRFQLTPQEETILEGYVEVLANYLAANGLSASTRLFLETACFIPGLKRRINPPLLVLQSNHGGFSDSRLREAAAWVQKCEARIEAFSTLAQGRLDRLLNFTNKVKPDEPGDLRAHLRLLMHIGLHAAQQDLSSQLRDHYKVLNVGEAKKLARYALRLLDGIQKPSVEDRPQSWDTKAMMDQEIAEEICKYLAVFQPEAFRAFHQDLIQQDTLYPAYLFRDALPSTTAHIRAQLNSGAKPTLKHLLMRAFVWSGNALAQAQLHRWMEYPPAWWEEVYNVYSWQAGWELTATGQRRDLCFETCFQLSPSGEAGTISVFTLRDDTCPWCHQSLKNLLTLDLRDPRLAFLGIAGRELQIMTCSSCLPWATIFADVDKEGKAKWSTFNHAHPPVRSTPYTSTPSKLSLAPQPRNPLETQLLPDGHSQIGGYPFWLNGADYPICPNCKLTMLFIGQVEMADVLQGEGWMYAFLCKACQVTATQYDQT